MPSGTLGQAALAASTNTTVYTVTSATIATISVNFVNIGLFDARVRLAIASTEAPANAEWLEFDAVLVAGGVLERSGLVLSGGKRLVARSSEDSVSVNVYGFEE
jgi:hypothetical protein